MDAMALNPECLELPFRISSFLSEYGGVTIAAVSWASHENTPASASLGGLRTALRPFSGVFVLALGLGNGLLRILRPEGAE